MTTPDPSLVRQMDNAQEGYRPVAGGVLSVDVERARAAIRELRAIAEEVASVSAGTGFEAIVPPASDEVSTNAAAQATRMVFAARSYLRQWHSDLRAGITALERQVADYEQADARVRT